MRIFCEQGKLSGLDRDAKVNAITANEVEKLDASVPLYLSVGKTFLYTERAEIESKLEKEIENITKVHKCLNNKKLYFCNESDCISYIDEDNINILYI